jgi:predicted nucleic acid-binding protein
VKFLNYELTDWQMDIAGIYYRESSDGYRIIIIEPNSITPIIGTKRKWSMKLHALKLGSKLYIDMIKIYELMYGAHISYDHDQIYKAKQDIDNFLYKFDNLKVFL